MLSRTRVTIGLIVAGGITVGALFLWPSADQTDEHSTAAMAPVPPPPEMPDSPFRNTSGTVAFTGRQTCAECHSDADRSYQQTAHSNAISQIDSRNEPADVEFFAPSSNRWYQVVKREDQIWHRESIRDADGIETIVAEHPITWTIGSGRFSKSYLAEDDGFLIQSPLTWYSSRPGWDLSPGYKRYNSSFERTAEIRCLYCHVGRTEPVDDSFHKVRIHTQAIDCERCHGPGSEHVQARSSGTAATDTGPDFSIVHPAHLDRDRAEAICAQCHLHGAALIDIRGRQTSDFRPGMQLQDVSIPYGLESPGRQMQVVGHTEQMRLSRCYQETQSLTCTTCHDPHRQPQPSQKTAYYRNRCLNCHAVDSCGLDEPNRRLQSMDDNCMTCHMPESPTEIPHFAFTHHRIGIHVADPDDVDDPAPQKLIPLADVSHLSPLDQDRCLGLAYVQVSDLPEHLHHGEYYRDQARRILLDVRQRGLRDSAVDAALARLFWGRDERRTVEFAESVLNIPTSSPDDRATALFTLATIRFQQQQMDLALPLLEELVQIRRYADAWHALSLCREFLGDKAGALEASVKAVQISPFRAEFHARAADLYRQAGNRQQSEDHRQLQRAAEKLSQQP